MMVAPAHARRMAERGWGDQPSSDWAGRGKGMGWVRCVGAGLG